MRFVAKIALIIAFSGLFATAQQPTFRSQTELVVIPTIVTDHSGAHVAGLKKEDFTVHENGAEQKIAVLEEVHSTPDRVKRSEPQGQTYSNLLIGKPTAHRLTIIAIDTINTPILDQTRAKRDIVKFLSTWANGGEPVSLVVLTRSGVKVIHDFTTDPKVLALALLKAKNRNEQVADEPSGEAGPEETAATAEEQALFQAMADAEENMASFQRRVAATMTLEAIQQLAEAYGGVPGRKSLLWASSGFPFSISDTTMSLAPAGRETLTDILPLYNRTWQVLNDAQVAVYPVDLRGLVTLAPGADIGRPSRNFNQRATWNNSERISTFQTIAEATGGRAFYNTNDLSGALTKAADDSSNYYLIGYYRDPKDTKEGWHKLKVSVHRSGVQVRARSGFFVAKPESNPAGEDQARRREIAQAMTSPMEYTTIGFAAQVDAAKEGKPGKKLVPFHLDVSANALTVDAADNNHVKIDFLAVAKTSTGETVAQIGQTLEAHLKPETVAKLQNNGTSYTNTLELPPGEYELKFVVRDALSGRMGSVFAPLKVN